MSLLRLLKKITIAATGNTSINRLGKAPLKSVKETEKLQGGSSDIATANDTIITLIRCKDNKVVFTLHGKSISNENTRKGISRRNIAG